MSNKSKNKNSFSDLFVSTTYTGILTLYSFNPTNNALSYYFKHKPHLCSIKSLNVSRNFIITAGSQDETCCVYNTHSLTPRTQLSDFSGGITSLDGILDKYILLGLESGSIHVYLTQKKQVDLYKKLKAHSSPVIGMRNDSKVLVTFSSKELKLYDIKSFNPLYNTKFVHSQIIQVEISQNKMYIMLNPNSIVCVDHQSLKTHQVYLEVKAKVLYFLPTETCLLVLYESGLMQVIDHSWNVVKDCNLLENDKNNSMAEVISSHPILKVRKASISNRNIILVTNSNYVCLFMWKLFDGEVKVSALKTFESSELVTNVDILQPQFIHYGVSTSEAQEPEPKKKSDIAIQSKLDRLRMMNKAYRKKIKKKRE